MRRQISLSQVSFSQGQDPWDAENEMEALLGLEESQAAAVEASLWWQQNLQKLTKRQQEVMELLLRSLSEREIAESLGVDKARVHRLKRAAQQKLQEQW